MSQLKKALLPIITEQDKSLKAIINLKKYLKQQPNETSKHLALEIPEGSLNSETKRDLELLSSNIEDKLIKAPQDAYLRLSWIRLQLLLEQIPLSALINSIDESAHLLREPSKKSQAELTSPEMKSESTKTRYDEQAIFILCHLELLNKLQLKKLESLKSQVSEKFFSHLDDLTQEKIIIPQEVITILEGNFAAESNIDVKNNNSNSKNLKSDKNTEVLTETTTSLSDKQINIENFLKESEDTKDEATQEGTKKESDKRAVSRYSKNKNFSLVDATAEEAEEHHRKRHFYNKLTMIGLSVLIVATTAYDYFLFNIKKRPLISFNSAQLLEPNFYLPVSKAGSIVDLKDSTSSDYDLLGNRLKELNSNSPKSQTGEKSPDKVTEDSPAKNAENNSSNITKQNSKTNNDSVPKESTPKEVTDQPQSSSTPAEKQKKPLDNQPSKKDKLPKGIVKGPDGRVYGPAPTEKEKKNMRGLGGEDVKPYEVTQYKTPVTFRTITSTNVLSRPSPFAALVTKLPANYEIKVTSQMGGWLEIIPKYGKKGYIFAQDAVAVK